MSRRGLYTIAPHARFLDVLADRVLDGTLLKGWDRTGPFWLSDITIILPTRRSRLTLADLFATKLGGAALLPDIRALGGEDDVEALFLPPIDMPLGPQAVSLLERRLILSRLVKQFALSAEGYASPPNAAELLSLADSLGRLIDDLEIEGGDLKRLDPLLVGDLAGNWQDVLRFLEPALEVWPKILAALGKVDQSTARNARLARQAVTAAVLYGERPVIAAGSTGSLPATANLLKAVAALPRGAVVLPGLDTNLTVRQHEMLLDGTNTEGHPQFVLARLLRGLGAGIADVEELAGEAPRTMIVRHALALADETTQWGARRASVDAQFDAALAGVSMIAAPNADMEARAVALATRQAVANKRTVGIVTRDQTLARRIAAELQRYAIEVDDPAGTPLFQSAAGRLVRQVLTGAAGGWAPLDTIALLRNKAVGLGLARDDVRRATGHLDLKLRRARPEPGLAGMLALTDRDEVRTLLDRLGHAIDPIFALLQRDLIEARELVASLMAAVEALIGADELPGLLDLRRWAGELIALADGGAPFAPDNLNAVLAALMAGEEVPPSERRREDVHIWGELEARLMTSDVMILAGVNEDIWPAPADPGPWLSRGMRVATGLAPPERRQGQAAHDFEMALGNASVIIAYAERLGTSPALPSRLVQRLDAFVGTAAAEALRERGSVWLAQATAIDFTGPPVPAQRPLPSPPASIRPRRISVTEVETLMRSPYDIYARHVLRLNQLEPLGSEPSARERGTMIHRVFEQFVAKGLSFSAPDAAATMLELAREAFKGLEAVEERRDIWLSRFELAADQFLHWERARHGAIASRSAEIKGEWAALDGFVLSGKADRIDARTDGLLEILDFKTGGVPAPKDMTAFDVPQLLLEAAMAQAGAFPGIRPMETAALTYIKIGLGPAAFQVRPFSLLKGMTLMEAVGVIERRTQRHIDAFLIRDTLPMAARIRPRLNTGRKPRPGPYDHLARTDEWTLTAGVDDP
ncbi:MAG: double-strand break repair protein AddB [Devosia sp.]